MVHLTDICDEGYPFFSELDEDIKDVTLEIRSGQSFCVKTLSLKIKVLTHRALFVPWTLPSRVARLESEGEAIGIRALARH